jgi:hypothetical protein
MPESRPRGGLKDPVFERETRLSMALIFVIAFPLVCLAFGVKWVLTEMDVIDSAQEQRVSVCNRIGGTVVRESACRVLVRHPPFKRKAPDDLLFKDEDTLRALPDWHYEQFCEKLGGFAVSDGPYSNHCEDTPRVDDD